MDVDEAIDHLYGLPLDRFTAERDELARRLRQEGARADGDRVKALRKPSIAAWAVNRVARGDADGVRTLLASVDELREAQADAVRGDAARFRDAAEAHRVALDRLADEGVAALEEAGGASATIADRVRQTLQAAAQDPAVRDDLAAGRLTRELQPGGIDALGLAGAVPVGRDAGGGGSRATARRRRRAPLVMVARRRRRRGGGRPRGAAARLRRRTAAGLRRRGAVARLRRGKPLRPALAPRPASGGAHAMRRGARSSAPSPPGGAWRGRRRPPRGRGTRSRRLRPLSPSPRRRPGRPPPASVSSPGTGSWTARAGARGARGRGLSHGARRSPSQRAARTDATRAVGLTSVSSA